MDSSGNVYVAGYTSSALDGNSHVGSTDIFVMKYDGSGTWQWTWQVGVAEQDRIRGMEVRACEAGGRECGMKELLQM